jgi:hypothetical protein
MTWLAGLVAAGMLLAAGAAADEPVRLQGDPLTAPSGLRLLVADDPPFVLDVASGTSTRVRGLRELSNVAVMSVGGRAGVVVAGSDVYAVQGPGARVTRLGAARAVVPAAGGGAVWLKVTAGTGCVLRKVRLSGRATGAPTRTPCGWFVQSGGSAGVVVRRTTLIDPATGRVLYRARWGILAAAGQKLVLAGPGKSFTLVDVKTGSEQRLPWPSVLSFQDRPAVDPHGRFVVLAFANPAWADDSGNTIGQVMDAWQLDTRTAQLTQVPGMPAFVGLKTTHMEWTADGRLVMLGEDDRRDFVAVWRPGQPALAVKTVRLPQRVGYSDSFAPLR